METTSPVDPNSAPMAAIARRRSQGGCALVRGAGASQALRFLLSWRPGHGQDFHYVYTV